MLAKALAGYLKDKAPHQVTIFHTGEECLKHIFEEPDIIILDYYMNSVDKDAANGMEILQVIKKNYPLMHIIMLSSQERYGIALETIHKGAEQYVIKGEDAFETIADMVNELD